VTLRDRDDRLPAGYPLLASEDLGGIESRLERFQSTPGAFQFESSRGAGGTPVADDRGAVRSDKRHADNLTRTENANSLTMKEDDDALSETGDDDLADAYAASWGDKRAWMSAAGIIPTPWVCEFDRDGPIAIS
jgi:hypothetical protein